MAKKKPKTSIKDKKGKKLLKQCIANLPKEDRKNYWMRGYVKQNKLDK